jgi:hypothetical protein
MVMKRRRQYQAQVKELIQNFSQKISGIEITWNTEAYKEETLICIIKKWSVKFWI